MPKAKIIGNLLIPLLLASLTAEARAQKTYPADAFTCPFGTNAIYLRDKKSWACRPKLDRSGSAYVREKHHEDPCPDGYWWRKTRETCTPIICKKRFNPNRVRERCPDGHHEHLNTGADWTRPVVCVVDFKEEHLNGEGTSEAGCDLCIIGEKGHFGGSKRPWAFAKPRKKTSAGRSRKGRKSSSGKSGGSDIAERAKKIRKKRPGRRGACPAGQYRASKTHATCIPCPRAKSKRPDALPPGCRRRE